jgi:isopentenyldiphosphate isomerase/intracellular septation protein A
MSRLSIILKLIPGFIPIIIYILIEEIYGTIPGLVAAIAIGIIEITYFFLKDKKVDKFVLADTLLIVLLGAVSLSLDNPVFFKIKPGLIQIIICSIIGLSAYSKINIVGAMTGKYLKRTNLDTSNIDEKDVQRSLKVLFWLLAAHTLLIFYATFYMSDKAWAFISSVLIYIIFGLFIITEFARKKIIGQKYQNEEWLPIVNEEGKITGAKPRSLCHGQKDKPLHPVVHLHVLRNNKLYLQKRSLDKKIQPGKWDTSVGGHVSTEESIELSLQRESKEELGLDLSSVKLIDKYIWESDVERELVFTFATATNQVIKINPEEIEEGRYWSKKEIERNLDKDLFTPNFIMEYNKYKNILF